MGALVVAAALLGATMVHAYWQTGQRVDTARSLLRSDSARSLATARAAMAEHHFTDPRPAVFIVEAAETGAVSDEATLEAALRQSKSYAQLSKSFAPVWATVNAEVLAASPSSDPTTTHH